MPLATIEVMESPGLVRDVPNQKLVEGAFTEVKNFRFNEQGAETILGDRSVLTEASFNPVWLQPFPPRTNPVWVYMSLTEAWTVDGSTHTEITRTVGGDYAAVAGERWHSDVLAGYAFFNNTVDVPQSWEAFDSSNALVNLANWDANRKCKSLRSFKNFLIALYMTDSGVERPYRVLWSNPAAPGTLPTSWDSSDPAQDANEIDLADTSDYLVDSLTLGDIHVIYKEASTWGMRFVGAPFIFQFWQILAHRGLLHRDCAVQYPGGHVVATQDDIIVHSGQLESAESIVNRRLRRWLFSAIDTTNFKNSFMFADSAKNEAWFCFPETGSTYANVALIWNWRQNSIGFRDLTPTPFAAVGPIGDELVEDLAWDPS